MTAATMLYAEKATDTTAATTTWVDVCQIDASSFTLGKKYLILANAIIQNNNSTTNLRVRLVHGTTPTEFTDGAAEYEIQSGQAHHCISWMYVYEQPNPAELIKLQISSEITSTVTCDLGQIFALKLSDDFTENTDWFYNEVTADYTTTTSYVAQASVTFTPNGTDNWLVIGHAVMLFADITTQYTWSLKDSVEGTNVPVVSHEGEDAGFTEDRSEVIMRPYTPSAAAHTLTAEFKHTTTAKTVQSSRIFAINLAKFAQNSIGYTAADQLPATTPSWTTTQTLSPTPSVTGDWFIFGWAGLDINTAGETLAQRLQINAGGGGLASNPAYGDDAPNNSAWDSADILPSTIFKMLSLTSGAARDLNYDWTAIAAPNARIQHRALVAFSAELPAVGGSSIAPIAMQNYRKARV